MKQGQGQSWRLEVREQEGWKTDKKRERFPVEETRKTDASEWMRCGKRGQEPV